MVTPEEDKEAIDQALCIIVGRARRMAEDIMEGTTELDKSVMLSLFYSNIHDTIKDLLDLVEFEVDENWGDDIEEVDDLDMAGKPESESEEDENET